MTAVKKMLDTKDKTGLGLVTLILRRVGAPVGNQQNQLTPKPSLFDSLVRRLFRNFLNDFCGFIFVRVDGDIGLRYDSAATTAFIDDGNSPNLI